MTSPPSMPIIPGQGEAEILRRELAAVLEVIDRLQTHEREPLLAHYHEALGGLEHRLLCLQVDVLALRRRIELLRQVLNRGEGIDRQALIRIEAAIKAELKDWHSRIQAEAAALVQSRWLLLHGTVVADEMVQRAKAAYRKLARLLHPDVSPEHAALFTKHWPSVQSAYADWDADLLEALLSCVEGTLVGEDQPLPSVADEVGRLRHLLQSQTERLARLRAEPPFCFAALLNDPAWVATRKAALVAAIGAESERRTHLHAWFEKLCEHGED